MKHTRLISAPRAAQLFEPGPIADIIANVARSFFDFKFAFLFERIPPGSSGGTGGPGGIPSL